MNVRLISPSFPQCTALFSIEEKEKRCHRDTDRRHKNNLRGLRYLWLTSVWAEEFLFLRLDIFLTPFHLSLWWDIKVMATFILLSELLVTTGLGSDTQRWFNFTTRPGLKRMPVIHSSLLNAALKGLWIKSVFLCLWDKIYLLLNCVTEPETIVQSPLQSPMWKSYLWTVWPPVRRRGRRQRSPHLMPDVNGVRLPIWNLVRTGKSGNYVAEKMTGLCKTNIEIQIP